MVPSLADRCSPARRKTTAQRSHSRIKATPPDHQQRRRGRPGGGGGDALGADESAVQTAYQRVSSQVRCPRPRWRRRPTALASHTQGYRWAIQQSSTNARRVNSSTAPGRRDPENCHRCARRCADGWHRSTCPGRPKTTWCRPRARRLSNCVAHADSRPTAENIVELTFWPEPHAVGPDHRPRRVVHRVRSTQPTGHGNRDATAHRVRSDPPRHSGNTGVPASSVAGDAWDASQPTPSVSTLRKKGDVVATTGEARFAAETVRVSLVCDDDKQSKDGAP